MKIKQNIFIYLVKIFYRRGVTRQESTLIIFQFFHHLVYRSQFAKTIPESKIQEPYAKKVVGLVSAGLAVSVVFFAFLRKYSKLPC